MSHTSNSRILVTGATGANGTELIKLFAAQGIAVKAMVRDPKRATALELPGVELIQADFDAPETLPVALEGVEKAFLLSNSSENAEEQQLAFVEAAKQSGVAHIVKLSQLGAESNSPNRFLRYHAAVEEALRASGIAYTFLRPNLFMQGLLNFIPTISAQNAFYAPAGEGHISVVDIRDIADVAFASLTQPGHEGKIYDLTGPEALTHAEMAAQLSQAVGRDIAFFDVPPQAMRQSLLEFGFPEWQADGLLEEYAEWSQDKAAQIAPDIREVTGRDARTFASFARDYVGQFK
ncbi:SDR family oxidoreductase [bacterium]|nr:MAG: SDR family oxidoreductase [bacterium]